MEIELAQNVTFREEVCPFASGEVRLAHACKPSRRSIRASDVIRGCINRKRLPGTRTSGSISLVYEWDEAETGILATNREWCGQLQQFRSSAEKWPTSNN